MARYLDVIDLPVSCEAAFDGLVDFSTTQQWDPSVVRARRLDRGLIKVGSRFEVVVRAFGVESPLAYELVVSERPHRIVLLAKKRAFVSRDEITLAPRGQGVRVTYDAQIEISGAARALDPLLDVWFQRSGARSAEGMRSFFSAVSQPAPNTSSGSSRSGMRARGHVRRKKVTASVR
jgi:hypothetical protein